jgi:hypothetical protein
MESGHLEALLNPGAYEEPSNFRAPAADPLSFLFLQIHLYKIKSRLISVSQFCHPGPSALLLRRRGASQSTAMPRHVPGVVEVRDSPSGACFFGRERLSIMRSR